MTSKRPSPEQPPTWHEIETRDRLQALEIATDSHGKTLSRHETVLWFLGWILFNQKLATAVVDLSTALSQRLKG
jgi:hypothetical protein